MRLKELRIKSGLTQNEIAAMFGVSSQTILNWENEIYEPGIKQLIQLADYFDVSVDYLIGRETHYLKIEEICKEIEKISKDACIAFIKRELQIVNKRN